MTETIMTFLAPLAVFQIISEHQLKNFVLAPTPTPVSSLYDYFPRSGNTEQNYSPAPAQAPTTSITVEEGQSAADYAKLFSNFQTICCLGASWFLSSRFCHLLNMQIECVIFISKVFNFLIVFYYIVVLCFNNLSHYLSLSFSIFFGIPLCFLCSSIRLKCYASSTFVLRQQCFNITPFPFYIYLIQGFVLHFLQPQIDFFVQCFLICSCRLLVFEFCVSLF